MGRKLELDKRLSIVSKYLHLLYRIDSGSRAISSTRFIFLRREGLQYVIKHWQREGEIAV